MAHLTCAIPGRIKMSTLVSLIQLFLLVCLVIPHSESTVRTFIRLNRYENPRSLKYDGLCCDGEMSTTNTCPFECDYIVRICLGTSTAAPCSLAGMTLNHLEYTGNVIQFPAPFFLDGSPNPFALDFDRWEGSVLITVYVFDQDTGSNELVDEIQFTHVSNSPARGIIGASDYVTYNNQGGTRALQPSSIDIAVAVGCARYFYGDACDIRCVDTNDCNGHYRCDAVDGHKICLDGWGGDNCSIAIGANTQCSNEVNCNGGGSCVKHGPADTDFYCCCNAGYNGPFCAVDIDECANSPCVNGLCVEGAPPTFKCECQLGWKGELCDQRVACEDDPCLNGGVCVFSPVPEAVGSIICQCNATIATGAYCETLLTTTATPETTQTPTISSPTSTPPPTSLPPLESCTKYYYGDDCRRYCKPSDDCFGHYSCDPTTGDKLCFSGWIGAECNITEVVDPSCPCLGGGQCFQNRCCCPPGLRGARCSETSTFCQNSPCQNGGTCYDDASGTGCRCQEGYTGGFCESLLYPNRNCRPNFYGPRCGTYCVPQTGCGKSQYSCNELTGAKVCGYGYAGTECDRLDPGARHEIPCPDSVCRNNGVCRNQTCCCATGYTGSLCHIEILECDSSPCLNDGQCEDLVGGYRCNCKVGFSGINCEDNLSETRTNTSTTPQPVTTTPRTSPCDVNPCGSNGRCLEIDANTIFCLCQDRYIGDRCERLVEVTTGSPQCPQGRYSPDCSVSCLEQDTCTGHFYCEPGTGNILCHSGWTGSFCTDRIIPHVIDPECPSDGTQCLRAGNCFQNGCCCRFPWSGDRCEQETLPCFGQLCGQNGICKDLLNRYDCECNPGYTGRFCEIEVTLPPSTLPTTQTTVTQETNTTDETTITTTLATTIPPVACESFFCYNGGECIVLNSKSACYCPDVNMDEFCRFLPSTQSTGVTTDQTTSSPTTSTQETNTTEEGTISTTPSPTIPPIVCGNIFCFNGGICTNSAGLNLCLCPSENMDEFCRFLPSTQSTGVTTDQTTSSPTTVTQETNTTEESTISTTPATTIPPIVCGNIFCFNGGFCTNSAGLNSCLCPSENMDEFCRFLPSTQSTGVTTDRTTRFPTTVTEETNTTEETTLSTTPATTLPPVACESFFCYNGGECIVLNSRFACFCPNVNMDEYCRFLPSTQSTGVTTDQTTSSPTTATQETNTTEENTVSTTPSPTIPPVVCGNIFCFNGGICTNLAGRNLCLCPSENMDEFCRFLPSTQSTGVTTDQTTSSPTTVTQETNTTEESTISTTPATTIPPIVCGNIFCFNGGFCTNSAGLNSCLCPSENMDEFCRFLPSTQSTGVTTDRTTRFPTTVTEETNTTEETTLSTTPATTLPPVACESFFCYNGGECIVLNSRFACFCPNVNMDEYCRFLPSTQFTGVTTDQTTSSPTTATQETNTTEKNTVSTTPSPTIPPVVCGNIFCFNGGICTNLAGRNSCLCPSENMDEFCRFLPSTQFTGVTTDQTTSSPTTVTQETNTTEESTISTTPATTIPPIVCGNIFCFNGGICTNSAGLNSCLCPSENMDEFCRFLPSTQSTGVTTDRTTRFPTPVTEETNTTEETTLSTTLATTIPPVACESFFCYNGGECIVLNSRFACFCPNVNMDEYCQFLPSTQSTGVTTDQTTSSPTTATQETNTTEENTVSTTPSPTIPPVVCGNIFCFNGGICTNSAGRNTCLCSSENMDEFCRFLPSTQSTGVTTDQTTSSPTTVTQETNTTEESTISTTPATTIPPIVCGNIFCFNGGICTNSAGLNSCLCPSENMDEFCRFLPSTQSTGVTTDRTTRFPTTVTEETNTTEETTLSTTPATTLPPVACESFFCYNGGECIILNSRFACFCPNVNMDEYCRFLPSTQSTGVTTDQTTSSLTTATQETNTTEENTVSTTPSPTIPPVVCGNIFCFNGGICTNLAGRNSCLCPSENMDEFCRFLPSTQSTDVTTDQTTSSPTTVTQETNTTEETTISTTPATTIPPIVCGNIFCFNGGICTNSAGLNSCLCPSENMDEFCRFLPSTQSTGVTTDRTTRFPTTVTQETNTTEESTISTTPATTLPPVACESFFCYNGGECIVLNSRFACFCPNVNMDEYCRFLPSTQSTGVTIDQTTSSLTTATQETNTTEENTVSTTPSPTIPPVVCGNIFCFNGGICTNLAGRNSCLCSSENMDEFCRFLPSTQSTGVTTDQTTSSPTTVTQETNTTEESTISTTPATTIPPIVCGNIFCFNGGICTNSAGLNSCLCPSENMDEFCRFLPSTQSTGVTTDRTTRFPTTVTQETNTTEETTLSTTPATTLPPVACESFFCYNGGECIVLNSRFACFCPNVNMDEYCRFLPSTQSTGVTTDQTTSSLTTATQETNTTEENTVSTTPSPTIPPVVCGNIFCFNGGICTNLAGRNSCLCPSENMDEFCRFLPSTQFTGVTTDQTTSSPTTVTQETNTTEESTISTTPATTIPPIVCGNIFCFNGGICTNSAGLNSCLCPSENMDEFCRFLPSTQSTGVTTDRTTRFPTTVTQETNTTEETTLSTTPATTIPPVACESFFCYNGGECIVLNSKSACFCPDVNMDEFCQFVPSTQSTGVTTDQTTSSPTTVTQETNTTEESTISTTPATTIPPVVCGNIFCFNGGICTNSAGLNSCLCPSENMDEFCRFLPSTQSTGVTTDQTTSSPTTVIQETNTTEETTISATSTTTIPPVACENFFCFNGGECVALNTTSFVCHCPDDENVDEFCRPLPPTQSTSVTTDQTTGTPTTTTQETNRTDETTTPTKPATTIPPVACESFFCYNGGECIFLNSRYVCHCPDGNTDEYCRNIPPTQSTAVTTDQTTASPSPVTPVTNQSTDSTTPFIATLPPVACENFFCYNGGECVTLAEKRVCHCPDEFSTDEFCQNLTQTTVSTPVTGTTSPATTYTHHITGLVYIKNPIDVGDYAVLILIIRTALGETYPDDGCCFQANITENFKQVDEDGKPVVEMHYFYQRITTSPDPPAENLPIFHQNTDQRLEATSPFDANQNQVYTGPLYDPEHLFTIYLIGPVIVDMYDKIGAVIVSAWTDNNPDCGCSYRVRVAYTRYFVGIYSTRLSQVRYVVWKDDVLLNIRTNERPANNALVAAFDLDVTISPMYDRDDVTPYASHYEIALTTRVDHLTTPNGQAVLQSIRSGWQNEEQGKDISIVPIKPQLRYTEKGSEIDLFPYFTYIDNVLTTPVQNSGPDRLSFVAPATDCNCRSHPVYSVDVFGTLNYFRALAVAESIVGQGRGGAVLVGRETIEDHNGNEATRILYKPQNFSHRPDMVGYSDIRDTAAAMNLTVPEAGTIFRHQYTEIIHGLVDESHRTDITKGIRQAWVETNSQTAPDFINIQPEQISIEITNIDSQSSLSDNGDVISLVHYVVTIGRADSSLTFATRPDHQTLECSFSAGDPVAQTLEPCECDHRLKQTIVVRGTFDPTDQAQMDRVRRAVADAWKEANVEYTGDLVIEPHRVTPNTTSHKDAEMVRRILFTIELSNQASGFRDTDLAVPDRDVINKHLGNSTVDIVVIEGGGDNKGDDDDGLHWYIILIIVLVILFVILIIVLVVCFCRDRRRKGSERIENDPEIFMERTFDKEHFTSQPVDYYNEAFDGMDNGNSANYVVNPEEVEGKSVL